MLRKKMRCVECLGELSDFDENNRPGNESRCVDCGCSIDLEAVLVWELAQLMPVALSQIMARVSVLHRDLKEEKEGFVWGKVLKNGEVMPVMIGGAIDVD